VSIGSSSAKTFTVSNTGNIAAALTYSALPTGVTKAGTCATTLAASTSCTVVLTFAPTTTAAVGGPLTLGATATSVALNFSGTGVSNPAFTLSSATVAFGNLATGASSQMAVSVNNSGNVVLSTPAITVTANGYSASQNCAATLAVGASCTVTLTFAPTAPQAYAGTLSVGFTGIVAKTAALSGAGITVPAYTVSVAVCSPEPLRLGQYGECKATVTNTGTASVAVGALYQTPPTYCTAYRWGTSDCVFWSKTVIYYQTQAFNDCPFLLAPGKSCTVTLPYTAGSNTTDGVTNIHELQHSTDINKRGNVLSGFYLLSINGGTANFWNKVGEPILAVSWTQPFFYAPSLPPTTLPNDYSGLNIYTPYGATTVKSVTLTNGSPMAIAIANGVLQPSPVQRQLVNDNWIYPPPQTQIIAVVGGTCVGGTIEPRGTCTVEVSCSGPNPGLGRANLSLIESPVGLAPGIKPYVMLKVDGVSPFFNVSCTVGPAPASARDLRLNQDTLYFYNSPVGVAKNYPATLRNTGTSANSLTGLGTLTGPDASSFSLQNVNCPATLSAGASCTLNITGKPTRTGALSATYTPESAAPGVPVPVTLLLTGT
jgi:hypothetical protein